MDVLCLILHLLGQILCLVSNGSIVTVIVRTSHLHTPSSMIVLALAFSDLLLSALWNFTAMGIISADMDISELNKSNEMVVPGDASKNLSGNVLRKSREICSLVGFLWQTLLATSTLYQAVIACDRYLFIVHPLRYEAFITKGKAIVVLIILALLALVLPGATLLSGGTYTYMPPASTCVSHTMWYVLFIALIYLPSFAVTLASNIGIWSLCVRQLNTPGRARLVREVPPVTHAYNLQEENGRVAVRRDIVDEFSCCIPALCRSGTASDGDSSTCLRHLVQNTSLIFIERFIAAVPTSPTGEISSAPECCQETVGHSPPIYPQTPTVLPPSPSTCQSRKNSAVVLHSIEQPTNSEGKLFLPRPVVRTSSDPQSDNKPLTPTSPRKPMSSPSSLSTRSAHNNRFRRTPSSFLMSHDLAGDNFCLPKPGGVCENQQEDSTRLLSPGVCSILKTSPTLSLEAFEMLEFSMQRVGSGNLQVTGLSSSSYPSTSSLRSMLSDSPGFFQSAPNNSSAMSAANPAQDQASAATADADKPLLLNAVVNPIFRWMLQNKTPPQKQPSKKATPKPERIHSFMGNVGMSLKLGRQSVDSATKLQDKEDVEEQEYDVIAKQRAPFRRRAKAAVLVALPIVSLLLTMLPLVVVQTLWVSGLSISSSATAWVCNVVYFIMPSLNPFLMGLTNRHLRYALADTLCCRQN